MKRENFKAEAFRRFALTDARQQRTAYYRDYDHGIVEHLRPDHYLFVRFEDLVSRDLASAFRVRGEGMGEENTGMRGGGDI